MAGLDYARFAEKQAAVTASAALPGYADKQYWATRYTDTSFEPFDWYLKWQLLKDTLGRFLTPESHILVLGCGTSDLTEQLYAEGFVNVSNIDQCEALIDQLVEKHQDKTTVQYEASPVHLLPKDFPTWIGKFDLAIDKGMLDSLACSADKWRSTRDALVAISAVLKPGTGIYACLSHASPDLRQAMLLGREKPEEAVAADDEEELEYPILGASGTFSWRLRHHRLPRPMEPVGEADAKGKAPAKGKDVGNTTMTPSPAFDVDEHVYHLYLCRRF